MLIYSMNLLLAGSAQPQVEGRNNEKSKYADSFRYNQRCRVPVIHVVFIVCFLTDNLYNGANFGQMTFDIVVRRFL